MSQTYYSTTDKHGFIDANQLPKRDRKKHPGKQRDFLVPDLDKDGVQKVDKTTGELKFKKQVSLTDQDFRERTDIGKILEKASRLEVEAFKEKHKDWLATANDIDVPTLTFEDYHNILVQAETAFRDLPSSVRAEFNHDAAVFANFLVTDPDGVTTVDELLAASHAPAAVPTVMENVPNNPTAPARGAAPAEPAEAPAPVAEPAAEPPQ